MDDYIGWSYAFVENWKSKTKKCIPDEKRNHEPP